MASTSSHQNAPETKGLITKMCIIPGRLDGKVAIITGADGTLGSQAVAELARRGAKVILACMTRERADGAIKRIMETYSSQNPNWLKFNVADDCLKDSIKPITEDLLVPEVIDLRSLQNVREFVSRIKNEYQKIDILINNATTYSENFATTEDGLEMVTGVSYLGHFLLTELLLPLIKKAAPSRIIQVSSMGHFKGKLWKPDLKIPVESYKYSTAYEQAKLAMVMNAREMSIRLEGSGVSMVSLHPGVVKLNNMDAITNPAFKLIMILRRPFSLTPWQGIQTTLYTVLSGNLVPGAYYSNCKVTEPNPLVNDAAEREWLYERSKELVKLSSAE